MRKLQYKLPRCSSGVPLNSRRFGTTHENDNGKAYGELETGAARLAFVSLELAKTTLKQEVVAASPDKAPLGFEIALIEERPSEAESGPGQWLASGI